MCQCGCGDFSPDHVYKFKDNILVIQEYLGCRDCDTPIGCVVTIFTFEEANNWGIDADKLEEIKLEFGSAKRYFPFVGRKELMGAAKELEEKEGLTDNDYESLADYLNDNGTKLLRVAMSKRSKPPA